jgi:hypothetical protein
VLTAEGQLHLALEHGERSAASAAVNATDIVVLSALITQPLPHGPDWPLIAGRQLAIFVNGLAASGPGDIPDPPVTRQDIETAFTLRAPPERPALH